MAEETDEEKLRKRHLRNQVSDFGASIPILMSSDTREDQQSDNTFRAALNAVIEDRNQLGTIQNEESNEVCFEIPSAGIRDNEDNILGQVIYDKCCVDEKPVMFYYTLSNVSSLVDSMNASCDGYVPYDDEWFVKEVNDYFTEQQLKEFLVSNPGVYRISPSECFSTDIVITAKGCCSSQTILATAPFSFTESIAESLITCSAGDYMLPETGSKMKVSLIDSGGTMGEWTYYDSFPVVINRNAEVEVFCQNIDYDEYIMNIDIIEHGQYYNMESLENSICNVSSYKNTFIYEFETRDVFKFNYTGSDTFFDNYQMNDLVVSLNGKNIQKVDTIHSINEWCYDNENNICVSAEIKYCEITNFTFSSIKSESKKIITSETVVEVEIYDQNGNRLGIFTTYNLIDKLSNIDDFRLNNITYHSFVGNANIVAYYIINQYGDKVIVSMDNYPIDFRYNKIITAIVDENN